MNYIQRFFQQASNALLCAGILLRRSLMYLAFGLSICVAAGCSEEHEKQIASVQVVSDNVASRINEMIISGHELVQTKFEPDISPGVDVFRVPVRVWAAMPSLKKVELAYASLDAGHHGLNTSGGKILPLSISVTNSADVASEFWIMRRGGVDFRSAVSIANSAARQELSDREKALSLWQLIAETKYHHFDSPGAMDPVVALNGYGYGLCGSDANNLAVLANSAGLASRVRPLTDHIVSEIFLESEWAMFDANHEFFLEDGDRLMSVDEIQNNLSKLPQFDPVGWENNRMVEVYGSPNKIAEPIDGGFIMNPALGPGDSVSYSFIDESGPSPLLSSPDAKAPYFLGKGQITRLPDNYVTTVSETRIILSHRFPYPMLGLRIPLRLKKPNFTLRKFEVSVDGSSWEQRPFFTNMQFVNLDLGSWIKEKGFVTEIHARLTIDNDGLPTALDYVDLGALVSEFSFNPRSLPLLHPGGNQLLIEGGDGILADFEWMEVQQAQY